ncbi:MAG: Flp pilus assembly complex ATPase component TadA [Fibrobacteraceae bacterium]|nr:Flp pilus assembly complex ATPase component TadA [Fibrobacteraceae bacterium]
MASEIEALLDYTLNVGASELIIVEGSSSSVRLAGSVCAIPDSSVLPFGALSEFLGALDGEAGTLIAGPWANSKWRVHYFREAFGYAAVFRPLMAECPSFMDLGAPHTLINLLGISSGLVVFSGPACSGKTTTAVSYVSALCQSKIWRASFLNDLEELPVKSGESLVLRDSSGTVSEKMVQALRSGGNLFWMGDYTGGDGLISMLEAADAGAVVVCNVNAGNAVGALDALLEAASPENRDLVRTFLSSVLKTIVVQRLLPSADGKSSVAVWEVLHNTQNVSSYIRSGEYFRLPSIIAASKAEGMMLMEDCLKEMISSGYIADGTRLS